jgi:GTP:adenosylcobinamide-phosphate guanylyltransferase
MKVLGVIPARFKSTRLEGKVLADIAGKPMVQHVYERALRAGCLDEVLVATDDERILTAVEEFGGRAVMTAESHTSGTDRIAEVAAGVDVDVVVNIQGDEPMLDPAMIEELVSPFRSDPGLEICTINKRVFARRGGAWREWKIRWEEVKMEYRAIKLSPSDNVAIAVRPIPKGKTVVIPGYDQLVANQEIPLGHKIGLVPIAKGESIIRYGEMICTASQDIRPGDWIHVHNAEVEH